jgi:hypothetical protein
MMRYALSLLMAGALTLNGGLSAQEPDPAEAEPAEAEPAEPEERDRWAAELGFAFNTSGGNEQLTVMTSHIGLSHLETSSYEASLGARVRYGRSEGVEVARNVRGNVSIDMWPGDSWSPFFFGTAENDPFKRLEARLNGGSGVKRLFWQDGWSEVSLSGAVLYSYENLDVPELEGNGVSQTARWSWRARARRAFGEGRRFEQLVYYQPQFDRADDYLFEVHTAARWSITRSLAFTTAFLYERDSTPAPEVGPDDWSLTVGLTIATRW